MPNKTIAAIVSAIDAAEKVRISWIPEEESKMTQIQRILLERQANANVATAVNRWLYSH